MRIDGRARLACSHALRAWREEIPLFVDTFLCRSSARYGKPVPELSLELREELERYGFPGDVRELENLVKRIVVLGRAEAPRCAT